MTDIPMNVRDTFYRASGSIEYVYFPRSGVISHVVALENGSNVEVAIVGNDGFIGVPVLLGATRSFQQVFCQAKGSALRMRVETFRQEIEKDPAFKTLCLRYSLAFLNQVSQSAACVNQHTVEKRFARWMLLTQDRVGTDEFTLTQEFLALMLGVRRASVTVAARAIQKAGLINYHRGKITILDRAKLEAVSCECYRIVRKELERVLE